MLKLFPKGERAAECVKKVAVSKETSFVPEPDNAQADHGYQSFAYLHVQLQRQLKEAQSMRN